MSAEDAHGAARGSPALFLDRDGVLNERVFPFVRTPHGFRWRPGLPDALGRAKKLGYKLVVVTNQWPVGAGRVTKVALDEIHAKMRREAAEAGGAFDRIAACIHAPSERCQDAKPSPRMLLDAAKALDVDLSRSWMVGDQLKDVLAGRRAGCRVALVNPAWRFGTLQARRAADLVLPGLAELVDRLP